MKEASFTSSQSHIHTVEKLYAPMPGQFRITLPEHEATHRNLKGRLKGEGPNQH